MKLATTYTGLRKQLMGTTVHTVTGRSGKVTNMERHTNPKTRAIIYCVDEHGQFATFPQWIVGITVEVREVIAYTLELNELIAE